jgi:hypothetical protein
MPADFNGLRDISANTPFAAITIRSLYNEREVFLVTTFPVADAIRPAPSPVVLPHIADGGGYTTEFIWISPENESSITLKHARQIKKLSGTIGIIYSLG